MADTGVLDPRVGHNSRLRWRSINAYSEPHTNRDPNANVYYADCNGHNRTRRRSAGRNAHYSEPNPDAHAGSNGRTGQLADVGTLWPLGIYP